MIRLNDLKISYRIGSRVIDAVDGVSLTIPDGCIVGIAGESGCGKSTLMKAIYGDIQSPMFLRGGSIDYGMVGSDGRAVTSANIRREWFKSISYIPQSSMNSLNPAPQNNLDSGGAAITVVHDFGVAKLTSLTGFQAYGLSLNADITDGFLSFGPDGQVRQRRMGRVTEADLSLWAAA